MTFLLIFSVFVMILLGALCTALYLLDDDLKADAEIVFGIMAIASFVPPLSAALGIYSLGIKALIDLDLI